MSSVVNLATAAASVLPLPSRSASSQNLLVILASSNSSPIAPPVLKSSSIAAMNFWRQVAAACRTGSLAAAEAASPALRDVWRLEGVEIFAGDAGVALEEAVERFEADAGFFDRRFVEEDGAAVVRAQQEEADSLAALALDEVGEAAGAFGAAHFAADGFGGSPAAAAASPASRSLRPPILPLMVPARSRPLWAQ